jgi:peptidoglycan-N-acetylglucosamine deacetylase
MIRVIAILAAAVLLPWAAAAQPCPGNRQALGTERVIELDANSAPRVGRKQFPSTLPLSPKELVLTFDDGPWPTTTPKVLDALKRECVRATFFLLGRNVEAYPQIARRELAEGHSLGHHTFSHPLLRYMPLAKARAEINRGSAAANRQRRFSVFRVSSPARHCSAICKSAASWCSAPTSGRATGCR